MKAGDLLRVNGETGEWFAEVVGIKDTTVEVYFIEPQPNKLWKYSDEWHEIPKESVLEHIVVTDVKKDFRTLGFRALDGTYFVKLDDPPAPHVLVPIGVQDSDSEDEDTSEMEDFIIPDHEGEPFTFADPSIPWVKETHEAVRAFEQWTPTPEGQKIKDFIERMDRRTCVQEDNRQFEAGKCLNYVKPPL